MATKDFAPIENDYAFFMAHATEARNDVAEYVRNLHTFADSRDRVRLLDFGCGTGDFSHQLLSGLQVSNPQWSSGRLQISLVEPVEHQRSSAARHLAGFSCQPIQQLAELPASGDPEFDLIVSNHVLYYVEHLQQAIARMYRLLCPGGRLLVAIAGWDNILMQFWQTGFRRLNRAVPYHAAEDVETILEQERLSYGMTRVGYQLRFPDTSENRLKILRFLFGDFLLQIGPELLLPEFDRFVRQDQIEIHTHSNHYCVERG